MSYLPHPLVTARVALLLLALFCACPPARPLSTQKAKPFTGFTLVRQVTDYDKAGNALPALTETLYVSAGGDWRHVGTYPHGLLEDAIHLNGRGMFFSDHRNRQLVKYGPAGSGRPARAAAERLRSDPKFVRTEYLLGRLAYVHRSDTDGRVEEMYYIPELGPFPFKLNLQYKGVLRVKEPVSLTFGEPEASQLRGMDYPLDEEKPAYEPKLGARVLEKPSPQYPAEARAAGISGDVELQLVVDEAGHVIRAIALSSLPLLGEVAMEAAYRARFSPAEREGEPVKVTGYITYQFPPR
jgi:TonB family protein